MVLVTAALGFCMGGMGIHSYTLLGIMLFGTALSASGASVLNQYLERDVDSLMQRTCKRPLVTGAISPEAALSFGFLLVLSGVSTLWFWVDLLTAFLALLSAFLYVVIYTPMKQTSVLNTWAGSVVGALPPLIGWAASGENLGAEAWTLFAILYFWQFPHFFALSWMYKEDYQKGGFRMLSFYDETGKRTGFHIISNTLILAVVSLVPLQFEQFSWIYLPTAILLGLLFVRFSFAFYMRPTFERAQQTFRYSIAYLPLLLLAMILDKALL